MLNISVEASKADQMVASHPNVFRYLDPEDAIPTQEHNLYNTPWSQFPARVATATTGELMSFIYNAESTPDWVAIARAELDQR